MSNGHKKRKITGTGSKQKQTPYGQSRGRGKLDLNDNDVISSSDDDFFENDKYRSDSDADSSSDDDNNEKQTVEEVKLKLAKQYLAKVEADVAAGESVDEDEDDDDRVGYALQHQRRAKEGTLNITIADRINDSLVSIAPSDISITTLRGHDLTPTCVALHQSGVVAYSGSKDNSIIQWDIENECRIQMISQQWKKDPRYDRCGTGEVLSMDVSDDGRYLAVGGRDGLVRVFDVRVSKGTGNSNDNAVTEFSGHKGPVTAIAFRNQSLQMFSGSEDRCIRHYNLDELTYVETLYGHQSAVIGIDCFRKERPISIGRDRTMRAWKVSEDSHLIFRGGSLLPPADCLSVIKDDWFVTGHENGVLSLWSTDKKKPVKMIDSAHGMSNGITSCGALKNSDLLATGSKDGFLRLWKVSTGSTQAERDIEAIGEIPIHGYINDIAVGPDGRFCIAAVGQEHRLGRWDRVAMAKNRFTIIRLPEKSNNVDGIVSEKQEAHMYPSNADDDESSDDENISSIGNETPDDDDDDDSAS